MDLWELALHGLAATDTPTHTNRQTDTYDYSLHTMMAGNRDRGLANSGRPVVNEVLRV